MLKNKNNKFICPKCGVLLPEKSNKCDYCGYASSIDTDGLIPVTEFTISNETSEQTRKILEFPSIIVLIIGIFFMGIAYLIGLTTSFTQKIYVFMVFGGFLVLMYLYQLLLYSLIYMFGRFKHGYLVTPLESGNYIRRAKAEFYDSDNDTIYIVSTAVTSIYDKDPRFEKKGYPIWFKTSKERIIIMTNKKCPSGLFNGFYKSLLAAGEEDSGNDD